MRSLAAPLITLMLSMGSAVAGPGMSADAINMAEMPKAAKGFQPGMVKAEVLLDRLHFSPGAIDGAGGDNFRKALAAFEVSQQLEGNGQLDQAVWAKLTDRSQDEYGRHDRQRRGRARSTDDQLALEKVDHAVDRCGRRSGANPSRK